MVTRWPTRLGRPVRGGLTRGRADGGTSRGEGGRVVVGDCPGWPDSSSRAVNEIKIYLKTSK
jgi:hypothetical protein